MEVVSSTDRGTHEVLDGAYLTQLAAGDEMSIQRFEVEPGAGAPEHDHHHEQAGYLIEGSLTIVVGDDAFAIEAGDSYVIPGGEPHAVRNRGDGSAIGIEVFSPPRPTPPWLEG